MKGNVNYVFGNVQSLRICWNSLLLRSVKQYVGTLNGTIPFTVGNQLYSVCIDSLQHTECVGPNSCGRRRIVRILVMTIIFIIIEQYTFVMEIIIQHVVGHWYFLPLTLPVMMIVRYQWRRQWRCRSSWYAKLWNLPSWGSERRHVFGNQFHPDTHPQTNFNQGFHGYLECLWNKCASVCVCLSEWVKAKWKESNMRMRPSSEESYIY